MPITTVLMGIQLEPCFHHIWWLCNHGSKNTSQSTTGKCFSWVQFCSSKSCKQRAKPGLTWPQVTLLFFYFSGVNSCPPGGHCSTPMKSWEDKNLRFCQVAQSFSWPLILRRGDDSNVVVINITICRIKHRVFPWEKYLVKSHPETSDFLHFYEDMC